MSNRRMLSNRIMNASRFLQMPDDAKVLYIYCVLNADDDGVVEVYPLTKLLSSSDDSIRLLIGKDYIRPLNNDQVMLLPDWKEHNKIRADRKIDSIYKKLLVEKFPQLSLLEAKPRSDVKDNSKRIMTDDRGGQSKVGISKVKLSKVNITHKEILNFWNSKEIIIHNKLSDDVKRELKKLLKNSSLEEIKSVITLYATILKDEDYYWTHKWNLYELLKRGFKQFEGKSINDYKIIMKKGEEPKPYYLDQPMVFKKLDKKWYVIDKYGAWLEFVGKKEDIVYK